jgi:hypothetical protein
MKPTNQVYEAAMKLLSPEMKPFLEWLEAERMEALELGSMAKLDVVQVVQGQAQGYKRVLDVVKMSRDMLEKTRA